MTKFFFYLGLAAAMSLAPFATARFDEYFRYFDDYKCVLNSQCDLNGCDGPGPCHKCTSSSRLSNCEWHTVYGACDQWIDSDGCGTWVYVDCVEITQGVWICPGGTPSLDECERFFCSQVS